jgi:pyruvate dehydrogenase E2 component (dihydrolipoamide acetyltransferase)
MGSGEPAMLLLHGFGGDNSSWMFNQAPLAESRRVIALDLPGHGGSSKDVGDGSVAALAAGVEAAIRALGLGRLHLVGHSLGGAVAMAVAARRPAETASLALVASAGLGPEIDGGFTKGFVAAERRKEMVAVAEMLFADRRLVTRKLVEDMLRIKRIDGVTAAMRRIADAVFPGGRQAAGASAELAALKLPMLVIWGGKDRVIPPSHAKAATVARLELLPEAGHMVHAEAYVEVNRLLAEFCAAND